MERREASHRLDRAAHLVAATGGAQNPVALCDVDVGLVEALAEAAAAAGAPGALAQMTFAPERPGAVDLPALLGSHGVLAAVGHTGRDADTSIRGRSAHVWPPPGVVKRSWR